MLSTICLLNKLVVSSARYEKDNFVPKSTFLVTKHDVNMQYFIAAVVWAGLTVLKRALLASFGLHSCCNDQII